MEFGMKRILASVKAMAILSRLYTGSPVSVQALSKESGLSVSYLEQIFKKLRGGNLVISQRGPGGGYIPREGDISVSEIIRTVSCVPDDRTFKPVIAALDDVFISQMVGSKTPAS